MMGMARFRNRFGEHACVRGIAIVERAAAQNGRGKSFRRSRFARNRFRVDGRLHRADPARSANPRRTRDPSLGLRHPGDALLNVSFRADFGGGFGEAARAFAANAIVHGPVGGSRLLLCGNCRGRVNDGVATFRRPRQGFRIEQIRVARLAACFFHGAFRFRAAHLPDHRMSSRHELPHQPPPSTPEAPAMNTFIEPLLIAV